MKKQNLLNFIEKYSLGGEVESVLWQIKNKKVVTTFSHPDRSLLGSIKLNNLELDDATIGIYTTSELVKLLNIMQDDLDIKYSIVNDKPVSLLINDNIFDTKFILGEPDIIPKAGSMSQKPNFELTVKVDSDFISKFLNAKNALEDNVNFAISSYDNEVEFILNYSTNNVNNVKFKTIGSSNVNFQPTTFSADKMKRVLIANKNCDSGEIKVSSAGLLEASFKGQDYQAVCYLVKLSQTD